MEKYGVKVDETKQKTASTQKTCPACGSQLVPEGTTNVPKCPKCGTRPFEKEE